MKRISASAFITSSSRFGSLVAADLNARADTLVRVLHLAMHLEGRLAELDINPLMMLPAGQAVKAVDALAVFRGT